MLRKQMIILGTVSGALTLGLVGIQMPSAPAPERTSSEIGSALAAVGTPKLKQVYRQWADAHEAMGGDRNVRFVLGRTDLRGHGQRDALRYRGSVRLDVIDGGIDVQVSNLPGDADYEVWLVDDRPGPDNSIQPDPSDQYLRAGGMTREGDAWRLKADLDAESFRDFQVDQLAVTRADQHPSEGAIVLGRPDFFQRLYTSLRTPELFAASDYARPDEAPGGMPLFGVGTAQASRIANPKPIEVDPDVVLDDLIALGADVFINEDFDGNGRTCETCHPFLNNITIDPSEIARRPDNDPLFLAEQNPAFGGPPFPLDIPVVLRETGLVGIPEDGPGNPPVNRAVPHLFAVSTSFGPAAPVVLPFDSPGAPPTPFPLPNPDDPMDPSRSFGLDVTLPPAGPGLPGGQPVPGAGFPAFGFTVDNGTNPPIDRLGFGGDLGFAPELGLFGRLGDAVPGAIVLLLTKTPDMVIGQDFRLPTPQEVDAVTAFYLTLGRDQELDLDSMAFSSPIAERGRRIFLNPGGVLANFPGGEVIPVTDDFGAPIGAGKCNVCHSNAGALSDDELFDNICGGLAQMLGLPVVPQCGLTNFNFETGVEQLPSQPARIVAGRFSVFGPPDQQGLAAVDGGFGNVPHIPGTTPEDVMNGQAPCFTVADDPGLTVPSGGFGSIIGLDFPFTDPQVLAGSCTEEFNTPPLVEAADTGPFFHNNNSATIEAAVEFYNTNAFRTSSAGVIVGAITDGVNGIDLENTEVQAVASFLRVINALENIRSAREFAVTANGVQNDTEFDNLLSVAIAQAQDASEVLEEAKLNARQADQINQAIDLLMQNMGNPPRVVSVVRRFFFFRRVVDQRLVVNDGVNQAVALLDAAAAGLQQQPQP